MFTNYNNFNIEFINYTASLVIFNILIYVFLLTNIFLIFFMFDLKYLKTLNELKVFNDNYYITFYLVLLFLSLAGTPPLIGFVGKFLIFLFIIFKKNFFILFIFILINFFSMYFYLQNLRFLVSKKISTSLHNNYKVSIYILNVFNCLNVFSILFFEDFFILLNYISSFINF